MYTAIVRFTRSTADDANVLDKTPETVTPGELAKQLASELQEAYDELSLAGEFQVETIILNGERHAIG